MMIFIFINLLIYIKLFKYESELQDQAKRTHENDWNPSPQKSTE